MKRNKLRLARKRRVRAKIFGTKNCPRLCVFRSNKNVYAQVIDDKSGNTLAATDIRKIKEKNNVSGARKLGREIGKTCLKIGIKKIVFDREGYKYHGKIKSVAEGAREAGINF